METNLENAILGNRTYTNTQVCQNQDVTKETASSVSWHISGWMERPVDNTLTRNSSETEKGFACVSVAHQFYPV